MVNTEKLNAYIAKAGTTWEGLREEIGLPETVEQFADEFETETSVDTLTCLTIALNIPANQIGLVFFAPAEYDEYEQPRLSELEDYGDILSEIFHGLSVKLKHKLIDEAYRLQDAAAAQ